MAAAILQASEAAQALVGDLRRRHGDLVLVLSHGCCDGTTPLLLPVAEWPAHTDEVVLGEVAGTPMRVSAAQAAQFARLVLTLDVDPGDNGAFSLEDGSGQRLVLHRVPQAAPTDG